MSAPSGSAPSDLRPPDKSGSPGSLITTLMGCYLRRIGGWIAVADLVALLGDCGVKAAGARQALRRIRSHGMLESVKRGSRAGCALTAAGLEDLEIGDERIFRFGQADPETGWVLAVFAVPESERSKRHQLRTQLGWLGFGSVSPGVRIAPVSLAGAARQMLASAGLDRYVTWFDARTIDAARAEAWWDFDDLRAHYDAFLADWQPHADAAGMPMADKAAFTHYLALVDSWRLMPRIDPGLPAALLPADWPGPRAWQVFQTLRGRWEDPGLRHVIHVTGASTTEA